MTKTKRVQKNAKHVMEAMHYAVKDLSVNGMHVAEAAQIVSDAVLARASILLVQAHGRYDYEANDLFANIKQLIYDYFAPADLPVKPEIIPDPPRSEYVVQNLENDSPEMMISALPIQEEPKKSRTPADILYPKRAS